MKKLASTQKVLVFFYIHKLITIKYEIMKTNVNSNPDPTQKVAKTVADHCCKDFHYTADELAEIEKKKDEHTKIDLGLQKYQGYY